MFLTVMVSVMTFEICDVYTQVRRYNAILDVSKVLSDKYFYQIGFRAGSTYKDDKEWIESLRGLDQVDDVISLNYFSGNGAEIENGEWTTIFAIYNISSSHEDESRIIPIRTTDGTTVDSLQPNEILLDESAESVYEIGDRFDLWIQYVSVEDSIRVEESIIPATVVGFVSKNEMVIYTGRQPTDLSNVYTTLYNPSHSIETMIIGGYPSYYCLASCFKDGDKTINYSEISPQMLLITPKENVNEDEFLSALENKGLSRDGIVSYSQLKENYIRNHQEEIRHCIALIIVVSAITISTVLTMFVDWYTRKRNEVAILTVCGSTLSRSIMLSVSPVYFSFMMGTLIGSLLWNTYELIVGSEMIMVQWYLYVVLFLVLSGVFSVGVLLYYFKFKRMSPFELYATKE